MSAPDIGPPTRPATGSTVTQAGRARPPVPASLPALAGVAATAGAAALAWAGLVERRWYALRHVTAPVLRRPATAALRLLHLSDLHQLPGQAHRLDFVRRCAATGPDVVVVTGDLLESDDSIPEVVGTLAEAARGRVGVAVLGSHDFWASTARNPMEYLTAPARRRYGRPLATGRLVDGLREGGYTVLHNTRARITTPAGDLDVAGLGDPHVDHDRPPHIDWRPPTDGVALRLGLVHAPYLRALETFDRHAFDLVLCGHTHGGQLRLPGIGALTNNSDLPLPQSRGLSRFGADLWLHVSAGLGTSRYAPIRFACRPEATLLDLVPRDL